MSLINKALKLEQQRRQTHHGAMPPMASRMAYANANNSKLPLLLAGFTGMGVLFAAAIATVFYFGSDFLNGKDSPQQNSPSQATTASLASGEPQPSEPADAPDHKVNLEGFTSEQLATVQQMLRERQAQESTESIDNADISSPESDLVATSDRARTQEIVDSFSIQGLRKAGADTRVFMNGKIQRLGDIVDHEAKLRLIGFTDYALVFEDPAGNRFEKTL